MWHKALGRGAGEQRAPTRGGRVQPGLQQAQRTSLCLAQPLQQAEQNAALRCLLLLRGLLQGGGSRFMVPAEALVGSRMRRRRHYRRSGSPGFLIVQGQPLSHDGGQPLRRAQRAGWRGRGGPRAKRAGWRARCSCCGTIRSRLSAACCRRRWRRLRCRSLALQDGTCRGGPRVGLNAPGRVHAGAAQSSGAGRSERQRAPRSEQARRQQASVAPRGAGKRVGSRQLAWGQCTRGEAAGKGREKPGAWGPKNTSTPPQPQAAISSLDIACELLRGLRPGAWACPDWGPKHPPFAARRHRMLAPACKQAVHQQPGRGLAGMVWAWRPHPRISSSSLFTVCLVFVSRSSASLQKEG